MKVAWSGKVGSPTRLSMTALQALETALAAWLQEQSL